MDGLRIARISLTPVPIIEEPPTKEIPDIEP
jgi:hypothetical protein